jgi:uncharacterized protein YndB with AHSA1/START domain
MATSRVTPDADLLVCEILIAAPPERVFQALVAPEEVPQWWGQAGVYRCASFSSNLRIGGKWRSAGVDGSGHNFEVSGEYLCVDPPHVLEYTWVATWTGDVKTVVRWELEPTGESTLVRLRHRGLAAHPGLRKSYQGWPRMLGWIQSFLERGERADDRSPRSAG